DAQPESARLVRGTERSWHGVCAALVGHRHHQLVSVEARSERRRSSAMEERVRHELAHEEARIIDRMGRDTVQDRANPPSRLRGALDTLHVAAGELALWAHPQLPYPERALTIRSGAAQVSDAQR